MEEVTNLKVVNLNNSLSDYLWMLKERGLHTPGLIAFFSYDPMSSDILQMCEMLEVQKELHLQKLCRLPGLRGACPERRRGV